ncbi:MULTISPECIES: cytochrome P450 [Nonomuraea]|uniref:Cytochrome P450 n=2 Tax=Nonomuraea TaxID=83681 RepID=A0ABW1C7M6_9ACTN|nr:MULTISPECIES: cytochrome P450 [Nonomuraea]MDA0646129.1 cytochrome P450 [Nonomuraea ferruginea]
MTDRGLPELLSPEVAADPHAFYRRLRAEAPVVWDESVRAYLVSRYEDVARVYKNPVFSTKAYEWQLEPVHGKTILQMDGTEHARHRALVSPAFRGKSLDRLHPMLMRNAGAVVEEIVLRAATDLAGELAGRRDVDLVRDFANYFPVYVIADLLGFDKEDHPRFLRWYTAVIRVISNLGRDPEIIAEAAAIRAEISEFVTPFIAERRANPGEDLLSVLATAEIDGEPLADDEIRAYVSLLLTAGAETTDKTFASLFRNLLADPGQFERIRHDRSLVVKAVAETLRFSPPTQINTRETTEDVELGGVLIPAGSTVLVLIGSANRDDRRYADPDRFVLERDDLDATKAFSGAADHLAFGSGRHFCLGAMLAKAELEIGVNLFLDRFPEMRLADPEAASDVGLKMRGPRTVPVTL